MSLPRRVAPGYSYLVTRRCCQRMFRLRPSDRTNQIFLYCLALAAFKTGVVVHAVCVMSNHHHLVVTDVHGVLPDFLRELHRTTAKAINALQGQSENLWNGAPTNVVCLGDQEDVIRKIAYVIANPVDAGLVSDPEEWPGVLVWGDREIEVTRPHEYFAANGKSPSRLVLRIQPPTPSDVGSTSDIARLGSAIAARVAEARRLVKAAGLSFLGRAAVLAASFVAQATSHEERRGTVPTVAAADPDVREALLDARRSFLVSYFEALREWCKGVRDVSFPFGTWWMRVHHRAAAATAGAAPWAVASE